METKDLLNIRHERLDYRKPLHKLLMDTITEYYGGPKLLNGDYIYSVSVLEDKDYVYVEKRPTYNSLFTLNDYGKIYGGLLFPQEILHSNNPVKTAKLLGLQRMLRKAVEKLNNLETELLALELEREQIEQDLLSLGTIE